MLKTILKISGLFSAIFVVFLIIFLKTSEAAPVPTPIYYNCTCSTETKTVQGKDFNFLEGFETKTLNRNSMEPTFSTEQVKTACTKACAEQEPSMQLSAYQKLGEQIKYVKPETTPKSDQTPTPKEEFSENCSCSDGSSYTVDDCQSGASQQCSVFCADAGTTFESCVDLTSKPVTDSQPGTDQPGTGQSTAGTVCTCNNNDTDSSKDKVGCDTFCQGQGRNGVKTFTPPQQGPGQQISGTSITNPIGVSSPMELIQKIINYVLGIVGAVAVLIIIYSGFVYMTSRGNEKQIESAKNSLTYAIVGLVVIFASIIIVNAVISAIGG